MKRTLTATTEKWPLKKPFRISRGVKTDALVVLVRITCGNDVGRGECLPYPRYGESLDSVLAQIESVREALEAGCDRNELQQLLPAGAARNALDCALLDLECKQHGERAWQRLGVKTPQAVTTAYTLSLDEPGNMAMAAGENRHRALLKLKLGPENAAACVSAVRAAAPDARLIVDANEAWSLDEFLAAREIFAGNGVEMVEQPLPAGQDDLLQGLSLPFLLGADESCHTHADLDYLASIYQVVNIKLDKSGGITEATRMVVEAKRLGLEIMVGCMLTTSLSMAPAMMITRDARFVDLDGPLLLKYDRDPGLEYVNDQVHPPAATLWG